MAILCWAAKNSLRSTAGVADTGEKFIAGVVDTADKHSFANISANFRKKSK